MNAVEIPWPPAALSPNARPHYMLKHRETKRYREWAAYRAHGKKRLRNPVLAVLPLVATRRRRDLDNVLASLKSALDGLTDAGWWNDDHQIGSIHLVPEVYSKKWETNRIVIIAVESDDEQSLPEIIKDFRMAVDAGHPYAALDRLAGTSGG